MSNGTRVFVGGLSHRVRERDLERFFQKIGRVKDIAMKNGYAFVVSVHYFKIYFQHGEWFKNIYWSFALWCERKGYRKVFQRIWPY